MNRDTRGLPPPVYSRYYVQCTAPFDPNYTAHSVRVFPVVSTAASASAAEKIQNKLRHVALSANRPIYISQHVRGNGCT
jgi:hypothetical protein